MISTKLGVILVRGTINADPDVKKTLEILKLQIKNSCVILDNNESTRGMLQVIKDYATWGVLNEDILNMLEKKRKQGWKSIGLNPPRKGFGRKGVKTPFVMGGALGNRKDKINDLLQRMM